MRLNQTIAEKMNVTRDSFGETQKQRTSSFARWDLQQKVKPKEFFLYQPHCLVESNRYKDQGDGDLGIVDLKIASGWAGTDQSNQMNLGYIGLHELTQATEHLNMLLLDEMASHESTTEMVSGTHLTQLE